MTRAFAALFLFIDAARVTHVPSFYNNFAEDDFSRVLKPAHDGFGSTISIFIRYKFSCYFAMDDDPGWNEFDL